MRLFVFKLLFRLTWWIAPNRPRVNKIFELYLEYVEAEENFMDCQERQAYLDTCIRTRTPTYEYLTCKKQRDQYEPSMPFRFKESNQPRRHYSDYEEAKRYAKRWGENS